MPLLEVSAGAKRVGFSVLPKYAPARLSVWGREIPSNRGDLVGGSSVTDGFLRIIDPTNLTVNPKIDPLDAWIERYNRQTADSSERIALPAAVADTDGFDEPAAGQTAGFGKISLAY